LADPVFRKNVDGLVRSQRQAAEAPAWFQQPCAGSLTCAAYFSMEFMLSEALPIYSGGLGNVAGDQLKAASDLGVPVVGVGLLYQQGYFRQVIDKDGEQQALYPYNDPGQLPITPLRQPNGEWLRLEIALPGYSVWLRAWQVQVGRVKLYLLDSNDAANFPAHRGITSELYGGGPELRLKQEMLLGIGGWRLLRALGIQPEVCHLNEGHAAFAVLERARTSWKRPGSPSKSRWPSRERAISSPPTRRWPPALTVSLPPSSSNTSGYAEEKLGIALHDLLALGRQNPDDSSEPFNMAYLAIRGSGAVNGVSRLHGKVSRRLFLPLFPRWPEDEVPVGHVTNGVHMPTWDSAPPTIFGRRPAERTAGWGRRRPGAGHSPRLRRQALAISHRRQQVSCGVRSRTVVPGQLAAAGAPPEEVEAAKHLFDPNALTLGFARRFATYKRPNLLLHDPERLLRLLTNPQRPVQLIIAGKAHPADQAGQALIQEWMHFIRRPEARAPMRSSSATTTCS
jgi:starch phosphorylase